MFRRRFLVSVGVGVIAGCTGGSGSNDGSAGTPTQVTTSSADGIEILVSQIAFTEDADGPNAYYRFRNDGDADATIKVETVLRLEGAGTYARAAYISVPAGDEVTLQYLIVPFDELSDEEERAVRRGEGIEFSVLINGRERPDA